MKYSEQKELVEDLRTLADFYERPESIVLPAFTPIEMFVVSKYEYSGGKHGINLEKSKRYLARIVKVIGSCEKSWGNSDLRVIKIMGHNIRLTFQINREAVCKKIPTGNKIIHAASYHHTPERVEDEFEWVCEDVSLLA